MLVFNMMLVILGLLIPIGMVIFWSKAKKISYNQLNYGVFHDSTKNGNVLLDNFIGLLYRYKSVFNIVVVTIVAIIEFLALFPF